MRIKLCVPYYLGYEFVRPSLERLIREASDVEWVDGMRQGSVITILRNRIVTNYLARNCDYRTCFDRRYQVTDCDAFFWVDSDIRFEPDDFHRLLRHLEQGAPVVSGLYELRRTGTYAAGWWHEDQVGAIGTCIDTPSPETKAVDWVGGGFVIVAASVYQQIDQPFYDNVSIEFDNGTKVLQLSEDLGFCYKLGRAGIPILADCSVVLEHQARPVQPSLFVRE